VGKSEELKEAQVELERAFDDYREAVMRRDVLLKEVMREERAAKRKERERAANQAT
jgi:hypothetical protein